MMVMKEDLKLPEECQRCQHESKLDCNNSNCDKHRELEEVLILKENARTLRFLYIVFAILMIIIIIEYVLQ